MTWLCLAQDLEAVGLLASLHPWWRAGAVGIWFGALAVMNESQNEIAEVEKALKEMEKTFQERVQEAITPPSLKMARTLLKRMLVRVLMISSP